MVLPKHTLVLQVIFAFAVALGFTSGFADESNDSDKESSKITLGEGQRTILTLRDREVLRESCSETVQFSQLSSHQVQLKGKRAGQCYFQTKIPGGPSRIFRVSVTVSAHQRAAEAIRFLLQQWPDENVNLESNEQRLEITGSVKRTEFYIELHREIGANNHVQIRLNLDQNQIEEVERAINTSLTEAGYKNFSAHLIQGTWILAGTASLKDPPLPPGQWIRDHFWPMQQRFEDISQGSPQIKVAIEFYEIRRAWGSNIGVEWPQWVQFVLGQSTHQTTPFISLDRGQVGGAVAWVGHLNELSRYSKLLARPEIVCLTGERVTFHNGGSFAVENRSENYARTDWKLHGLQVELTPVWDPKSHMHDAALEVTMSDPNEKKDARVVAMKSTALKTHFKAQDGKPVVLTGFYQKKEERSRSGLPWTSRIPWIRWFTGNRQAGWEDTELALKITLSLTREEQDVTSAQN